MLFTSFVFYIFFPICFILYWAVFNKNVTVQNSFLLAANYFFYCWWDWRFLVLLAAYGIFNYYAGLRIYAAHSPNQKKRWLLLSLFFSLGILIFFKYTNFFITSFSQLLSGIGVHANIYTLNILLPLGISFYTFSSLGYVLDIHKEKTAPTRHLLSFLVFSSFFAVVLSGPVERSTNLLVQLRQRRIFNAGQAKDGLRQIVWGLYKKVVVADNLAAIVNDIFSNYWHNSSFSLLAGALLFPVHLYADFSGYSDIAIGLGKLLGFDLVRNFAYPFFARNIAEFWRRWHMSLTAWFTEYLFTPLSIYFRDYGKLGLFASIIITYVIIGFWHGANWTFIVFGIINGVYFLPIILKGKLNKRIPVKNKWAPSIHECWQMIRTYSLVAFAEIFFRADTVSQAGIYIRRIFSKSIVQYHDLDGHTLLWVFITIMFIAEWLQRNKQHALQINLKSYWGLRWAIYTVLILLVFFYGGTQQKFIYFQF